MPTDTKVEDIEIGAHARCNIMCSILTLGMVPIEFLVGFGRMQMPINGRVAQHIVKGVEVGKARTMCVDHILEMPKNERPKWLFFLGDDMIPSWDGFVKLHEEAEKNKWDCLTGLYFVKQEPPTPLMWRNDLVGRMQAGRDYKVGDVVWVDMTGLDFTLIRVELLEKMQIEQPGQPFFKTGPTLQHEIPTGIVGYKRKDDGSVNLHTEDHWFYNKAKELGAKIGVHTGVRVAHFDVHSGCLY